MNVLFVNSVYIYLVSTLATGGKATRKDIPPDFLLLPIPQRSHVYGLGWNRNMRLGIVCVRELAMYRKHKI